MPWTSLTLLQRAVLRRLETAGFSDIADVIFEAWRAGEGVNVARLAESGVSGELLEDLRRANGHARPEL